jgi:hypothetical protein
MDVQLAGLTEALAAPYKKSKRLTATIRLALDYWTWRRLTQGGLGNAEAAELAADLVGCTASLTRR